MIEAEDRPALQRFNEDVLPFGFAQGTPAWRYRHVMLIDGNDDRGIDVGLLTATGSRSRAMRSHVDDLAPNGEGLFSRDCPEYELALPGGKSLLVLVNHFKSKGHGTQASNNARRLAAVHPRGRDLQEPPRGRLEAGRRRRRPQRHARERPAGAAAERHRPQGRLAAPGLHPGRRAPARSDQQGQDRLPAALARAVRRASRRPGSTAKASGTARKVKNPWPMLDTLTKASRRRPTTPRSGPTSASSQGCRHSTAGRALTRLNGANPW